MRVWWLSVARSCRHFDLVTQCELQFLKPVLLGSWQSMRAVAVGSCSFQTIRSSIPKNIALQKASDHQAKTSSHNQANTISDHVHPFLRPAYVRLNELYAEPKQSSERKNPPQKSWSQDGGRQDQSGKGGHMRQLVDGKRIDLRQILGRERQPANR